MSKFFLVPASQVDSSGFYVGGAFFPYKKTTDSTGATVTTVEMPDDGDYAWAMDGFVQLVGPQVPNAPAVAALPVDTTGELAPNNPIAEEAPPPAESPAPAPAPAP